MKKKSVFFNHSAIALTNALRSPKILQALAKYHIDEAQLKRMQVQLHEVQTLDRQYHDAVAEARAATQSLYAVRRQVQQTYSQHIQLCRIVLKDQPVLLEKMDLNGARKKALAEWMDQTDNFYRHAITIKETLAPYHIMAKELSEMQKLLNRMTELQALQFELKGAMQVISEQKKRASKTLKQSMSKFFQMAKIALGAEPQQLEALGLVVKAEA